MELAVTLLLSADTHFTVWVPEQTRGAAPPAGPGALAPRLSRWRRALRSCVVFPSVVRALSSPNLSHVCFLEEHSYPGITDNVTARRELSVLTLHGVSKSLL